MKYKSLDIYDEMPDDMKKYISNYGWHFNKKAHEFAVSLMKKKNNKTNRDEPIVPYTKEDVDRILHNYNVQINNKILHDYVFVANMCKADYLGSSVPNEEYLAKYVKDTVDDVDASEETTFRRWVSTMIGNGQPIDWEEIC